MIVEEDEEANEQELGAEPPTKKRRGRKPQTPEEVAAELLKIPIAPDMRGDSSHRANKKQAKEIRSEILGKEKEIATKIGKPVASANGARTNYTFEPLSTPGAPHEPTFTHMQTPQRPRRPRRRFSPESLDVL
jgi:hypothetical protein